MGVVYKARDTHLDRLVALKILPPERVADLDRKRRFIQEAKAASALNHPNIVAIHDIDQAEGIDFIAMECDQRRMRNRSDRVDDVVLTGQHLPADWHSRCESNVKELSQEHTFAEVFVQCLGSQMERHEGCSLKMHGSGKKKIRIR